MVRACDEKGVEYVGKRATGIEMQGSRRRGRPKKRWADCVNDDMREKGLS